jgi:hypothetical protein
MREETVVIQFGVDDFALKDEEKPRKYQFHGQCLRWDSKALQEHKSETPPLQQVWLFKLNKI